MIIIIESIYLKGLFTLVLMKNIYWSREASVLQGEYSIKENSDANYPFVNKDSSSAPFLIETKFQTETKKEKEK